MRYQDFHYTSERIRDTFISYKNKLVRVLGQDAYDGKIGFTCRFRDNKREFVPFENLDLTPVPLGYVNYNTSCSFVTRAPMRRDWRQGLRINNIRQFTNSVSERLIDLVEENVIYDFEHCVKNEYPSFKECLRSIEETHDAQAFNREFSLDQDGVLTYRGLRRVGEILNDNVIGLRENSKYLQEVLTENLQNQHVEVRIV